MGLGIAGLNFGGSKSSGSSTQRGTATTTGSSVSEIFGMDAASKILLDKLTSSLSDKVASPDVQYSKEQAIKDSQASVDQIFKQYRETDLPQIFGAVGQSGAYNSTAGQQLANDAFGEAVGKAATLTLQTIKDYAGISREEEGQFMNGLLAAFQQQGVAYKKQTESATSTTNSSITESSKSKSGSFGLSFGK